MPTTITYARLSQLAGLYGTPLYVYHADSIAEQYARLDGAFALKRPRIFYASKALTNPHILQFIHGLGAGIDCSSINEVLMAIYAGVPPSDILYTSNGIHFEEIESAVLAGVHINIDSLSNLARFGEKYGGSYPVGIRLRPNIMAGGNIKISTGHANSKFGIPIEQLGDILQVVDTYGMHIRGLHIHTGSEIKDVSVTLKALHILFALVPHFPQLAFLDLGGGFKVPYLPGEEGTDIGLLAREVEQAFSQWEANGGRPLELWFEPGKYLVSMAGYFVTQVNVMKQTDAATFISVNSGFNHLIRPMFYDSYHHISNISNPDGAPQSYAVVGNICETDTFAWDRQLPEVREGDLLVFHNAGAYGFEMSSNFNSRYRPAEVLVRGDEPMLIRRREHFEDLTRTVMPLPGSMDTAGR